MLFVSFLFPFFPFCSSFFFLLHGARSCGAALVRVGSHQELASTTWGCGHGMEPGGVRQSKKRGQREDENLLLLRRQPVGWEARVPVASCRWWWAHGFVHIGQGKLERIMKKEAKKNGRELLVGDVHFPRRLLLPLALPTTRHRKVR